MPEVYTYIEKYLDKGRPALCMTVTTAQHRRTRPPCEWCGLMRRGISARRCRICQFCEAAHYCSIECQMAAWSGGHWIRCAPASKVRSKCDAGDRAVEDVA